MQFRNVLAIGAHTDDIELGCGGLLSRLHREGSHISVLALSRAETSLPEDAPPATLEDECRAAMRQLGLDEEAVMIDHFPVRRLSEHRQDILERMVTLNRHLQPDLVLTMNSHDTHQDHQVAHAESVRAFRTCTLLGYESPWNQPLSRADLFVELTEEDVDRKVRMLSAYESQIQLGRAYVSPEYIRAAARFRGVQGRLPLAEVFEVNAMRWAL